MQLGDESGLFVYLYATAFALTVHLCNFKKQAIAMKAILRNRIFQHSFFWSLYFLLFFINFTTGDTFKTAVIVSLVSMPYQLIFTYTQLLFLIPRYLLKRKWLIYVALTLLLCKICVNISMIIYWYICIPLRTGNLPAPKWEMLYTITPIQVGIFFAMLTISSLAVSIEFLKKWYIENDRNQKIEKEKMVMELEMLKAQVHPHFLFNTLNNLYSLTLTHSDSAPVVVTHLSGLLRYMLYECNEKEVPLNNEIAALKKYTELEKLRYGNRLDISFSCTGQTSHLVIAPLLLIPFVENSFKHGVSEQLDQCWINLHLHAEHDVFTFNLSNSCSNEQKCASTGGIGLNNIKKRLDLIYAGQYDLNISEQEEMYVVKLTMQLSPLTQPATSNNVLFSQLLPATTI